MACRMIASTCRILNLAGTRNIATQALATRCAAIKDEITHTGQVNVVPSVADEITAHYRLRKKNLNNHCTFYDNSFTTRRTIAMRVS